jgi:hypothetical protein
MPPQSNTSSGKWLWQLLLRSAPVRVRREGVRLFFGSPNAFSVT